jgi:hypothetical protein
MSAVSESDRAVFARVADYLIPEGEGMPAASQVGVPGDLLDAVLAARPDLVEPFLRGLRLVKDLNGRPVRTASTRPTPRRFMPCR